MHIINHINVLNTPDRKCTFYAFDSVCPEYEIPNGILGYIAVAYKYDDVFKLTICSINEDGSYYPFGSIVCFDYWYNPDRYFEYLYQLVGYPKIKYSHEEFNREFINCEVDRIYDISWNLVDINQITEQLNNLIKTYADAGHIGR